MTGFRPARTLIFAGVLCASALVSTTGAAAAAPATKIAVANTGRIFNDMQETKDLKAKLEDRRKKIADEEQQRRAAINKMQQDLSQNKPDSPQYNDTLDKLDEAVAGLKVWEETVQRQAERTQKATMKMLFDKLQTAVAEVAKDQSIDLVIADQGNELPNTDAVNFDQLRAIINQRAVLYASTKTDISEAVLTLLDARYAKEKATK